MYHERYAMFLRELDRVRQERICASLYGMERALNYRDLARSAVFCADAFREGGIREVALRKHPADGLDTALDFIMPQAWDCDGASLTVVSPQDSGDPRLADRRLDPFCVANHSPATPPSGITAEVVTLEQWRAGANVRGKWLFSQFQRAEFGQTLIQEVVAAGAAGFISNADAWEDIQPHGTRWINGWGFPYWHFGKDDPILPCFSLTPSRARHLAALLRQGPVTMHGVVNSRSYDGEICTVSARIPGESDEEIALLAHIYEPFIPDDASGAAAVLEIGRMLTQGQATGALQPMKRSIRLLISMEQYGFARYFADPAARARTVYALNMDGLAYDCFLARRPLTLFKSPHTLPFVGDFLLQEMAEQCLPEYPLRSTYQFADNDNFVSDSTIGIPSSWIDTPNLTHHNSRDRLDRLVDWEALTRLTSLSAAYVSALAGMDENGASGLLRLAARRGRMEVLARAQQLETEVQSARIVPAVAARHLRLFAGWQQERIRTIARLGPADPEPVCAGVAALAEAEAARFPGDEPPLSPEERKLRNLVVRRLGAWFPASQARIPYAKRVKTSGFYPILLNWCDGRRDLLDVLRCFAADDGGHRLSPAEQTAFLQYLRTLAEYGYLEISQRGGRE